MYSLLLETSSKKALIFLALNDTPVASQHLKGDETLSTEIYPALNKLFLASSLKAKDLSYIAVGTGPGSYTGIRIGASIAKALAFAFKIPLIGFCSLKALLPPFNTPFYTLSDAKSGGFFLLEGEKIDQHIIYKGGPQLISFEEAKLLFSKNYLLLSSEIKTPQERLPYLPAHLFLDPLPDAKHLARLAYTKYMNKKFDLSHKLELLYLRNPNPVAL
ncbi:MAG: tRNA (adenosine(37)-N6)-threonylcarbamoyltransferase complex dimerization subunit type 1 TsaB [Parachlamydiales bacterium]|jgi:tRNA threonylcarbamoyl adenosine modification protein YeaZ